MLTSLFKVGQPIELKQDGLLLRLPSLVDFDEWRELRSASKDYLSPYEPTWGDAELTLSAFKERVRRAEREANQGLGYAFLIHDVSDAKPRLVGGINVSDIRRRVAQCANIGYWMGETVSNKGMMTRALGVTLQFVFGQLNLHRANAACLVHNQRSIRVLEKNGFVKEGFAEGYLKINGTWQDHLLFGLTIERFEQNKTSNDKNQKFH